MAKIKQRNAANDIKENIMDPDVLSVLLMDRTTGKNIIWATDDYAELGDKYTFFHTIDMESITGENGMVIRPRIEKDKATQVQRSHDKAEVFTPSWVCNAQNNLVDDAWFGKRSNRFNKEIPNGWESTYPRKNPLDTRDRIKFSNKEGKTWKDYVLANRMEVSCGEAPYLTSRYDTVSGQYLKPKNRIGLLDRKLRVIYENVPNGATWLYWAEKALQSTYGFEWQGDNILLARENLLYAVAEYYTEIYGTMIKKERLLRFAEIISWNIWQMDGIKFVIPQSCHEEEGTDLLGDIKKYPCQGCKTGNHQNHNGIYAVIKDWQEKQEIRFVDVLKGEQ